MDVYISTWSTNATITMISWNFFYQLSSTEIKSILGTFTQTIFKKTYIRHSSILVCSTNQIDDPMNWDSIRDTNRILSFPGPTIRLTDPNRSYRNQCWVSSYPLGFHWNSSVPWRRIPIGFHQMSKSIGIRRNFYYSSYKSYLYYIAMKSEIMASRKFASSLYHCQYSAICSSKTLFSHKRKTNLLKINSFFTLKLKFYLQILLLSCV